MIARIWHGRTRASDANAYRDYVMGSGVNELQRTLGNRGVFLLRKLTKTEAEFLVISLWDSFGAIHSFAGGDLEKARYFDQDRKFLLEFEPNVVHYEVLSAPSSL
jgi:heme-degrading monooxygenase HmoA